MLRCYQLYWIACGVDDFLFKSVEYMTEFFGWHGL